MKRSPEFGSGEECMLQEAGAAQAQWLFPNLQRVGEHFFQSSCCVYVHGFSAGLTLAEVAASIRCLL